MNRRKTLPPRGKVWRVSSVRAILTRRKYTGTFVYGARNSGKYFAMRDGEIVPRRKSDKAVSAEPIVHAGKFEAIVSQKVFDQAQTKLASRKGNTTRKQARQYLLAGLVKCGDCQGSMGGLTQSCGAQYHCRTYHQTGSTSCRRNTIPEAPLVDCVVRMSQERYLSDSALARLRRSLENAQDRTRPRPRDLARLRQEIQVLDRKIDQGAERVLEAPSEIVPALYRKLEELRAQRERLRVELEAHTSRQASRDRKDGSEIDRTIEALQSLGEALRQAGPAETKEILNSLVTKIELYFQHEQTDGGRERNEFAHGKIFIRPDAGGALGGDPKSAHMNTIGSFFGMSRNRVEFETITPPRSAECGQVSGRENEALFPAHGAVLVFYAQDAIVAAHPQMIDVLTPLDGPGAGNHITPPAATVDPHVRPGFRVDQRVLSMRVEDAIAEEADRQEVIAFLVDQVRGIVVEAEVVVFDRLEQALERVNTLQAGLEPVLDGNLDPLVLGVGNDRGIDLGNDFPDLVDLGHVRERHSGLHAESGYAQRNRCVHHLPGVILERLGTARPASVAEAGQAADLQLARGERLLDRVGLGRIERRGVNVLAAGIGHHFETSNAGLLSEVEDVHQCLVSERGGQHADAETFRLCLQALVLAGSCGPCLILQLTQCHDSDGAGCRTQ